MNVYVLHSRGKGIELNRDLDLDRIRVEISVRKFNAFFPDPRITENPFYETAKNEELFGLMSRDFGALYRGTIGQVWVYGTGFHGFAMTMLRLAYTKGVRIVSFAPKDSTFDQVLLRWFKAERIVRR